MGRCGSMPGGWRGRRGLTDPPAAGSIVFIPRYDSPALVSSSYTHPIPSGGFYIDDFFAWPGFGFDFIIHKFSGGFGGCLRFSEKEIEFGLFFTEKLEGFEESWQCSK